MNTTELYSKARTIQTTVSLARELHAMANGARNAWRTRTMWQLSIDPRDRLHALVTRWVAEQLDHGGRTSLGITMVHDDDGRRTATYYDASTGPATVMVGRHEIRVALAGDSRDTSASNKADQPMDHVGTEAFVPLLLQARTRAGRDALIAHLNTLAQVDGAKPFLYFAGKYGWGGRPLEPRPLDTVILPGDLAARALADLKSFLDAEEQYAHLGLPWHRGYLFHGPPGTGKTSLARALAHEARMNLYYLSLSGLKSDTDLTELIAGISPKSILLIEDVDVFHATRNRDAGADGISMSGLLNSLDGVITPHGLVTILTTNRLDQLDGAIRRPGRADFIAAIDRPTVDQVTDMITRFRPGALLPAETGTRELRTDASTATVAGVIKEHLHSTATQFAAALDEQVFYTHALRPIARDQRLESANVSANSHELRSREDDS